MESSTIMRKHTQTRRERFRVGDEVTWNGSPGELSYNRNGKILSIKRGIATVSKDFSKETRQVPIKILKRK